MPHHAIRTELESKVPVLSLCWRGASLIDVAGGMVTYALNGDINEPAVRFAHPFDAALVSPSGNLAVIYERQGTKGALVDLRAGPGQTYVVRELNRSFYHAKAYEYPVAFVRDSSGRELLAHCPAEYNELQIEHAKSGEPLTARSTKSSDFFHSRLRSSPNGKYLLSAGWLWHPLSWLGLYDVSVALTDPRHLDELHDGHCCHAEINSAEFGEDNTIVLTGGERVNEPDDDDGETRWRIEPGHVAVFELSKTTTRRAHFQPPHPLGDMMVTGDHVVGFYEHPRLYSLRSGSLVAEWPDIPTGKQNSSILTAPEATPPPIAKDPQNQRFAVVCEGRIVVVQLQGLS